MSEWWRGSENAPRLYSHERCFKRVVATEHVNVFFFFKHTQKPSPEGFLKFHQANSASSPPCSAAPMVLSLLSVLVRSFSLFWNIYYNVETSYYRNASKQHPVLDEMWLNWVNIYYSHVITLPVNQQPYCWQVYYEVWRMERKLENVQYLSHQYRGDGCGNELDPWPKSRFLLV